MKKTRSWRRADGEEVRIGRQADPPRAAPDVPDAGVAPDNTGRSEPFEQLLPPRVSDKSLRPDRSNQPRVGETFDSEFLDNLAHQMVAPLQAIAMHGENILDGHVDVDRVNTRVKEIVGHARVLAELARRMRFLHELVSGKKVDCERLGFKSITTAWIDGFNNYLPYVRPKGVGVDIRHEAMNSLPNVLASRLAAHQVMMNLYDNAVKYGAPMSTIRIQARREGNAIVNDFTHQAHVPLTDTAVAHVFERGYRAPEAQQVAGSGTGVGMWISRELMRSMQGDLLAFATDPEGITRFRLLWRIA